MKTKLLSILLALSMMLTVLAACGETPIETPNEPDTPEVVDPVEPETPEEPEVPEEPEIVEPAVPEYSETEVGAENTLTNAGTTITLNVSENKLYITNAATTASNVNLLAENSEFALPKCYQTEFPSKETFDLNWVFTSAAKFENKEVNDVMTSGLIYNFEDTAQNVKLRVYCVVRNDISGPFEFYTEVENLNDAAFRLAPYEFATFTLSIPDPENTLALRVKREGVRAEGFQSTLDNVDIDQGTGVYIENFSDRYKFTSDATTNADNDFLLAQYINRGGKDGLFYALEWTNGVVQIVNNYDGTALVTIDMDLRGKHTNFFTTEIPAKETFLFPSVYFMPYDGSFDDGANIYKNWFFACKTQPTLRDNPGEPLVQIDNQMSPDDAVAIGIESMKWEYGWWTTHGFKEPYSLEGSWELRHPSYTNTINSNGCETLAEFGELMNEKGLKWTIYLLLHDTVDADRNVTDQYGEFNSLTHPEWFSNETSHDNKMADLGNTEAVEYLKGALSTFFSSNNIDTWRTDFQPIIFESDKENRHDADGTDVQYWATVGFGEILDHLYATVDGFRYECCDSGGCSKSIYLATKAVVFNTDDSAAYTSLRATFYDSSYIFHPSQLQFPCNIATFNPETEEYFYPVIPEPVVEEGDTYDFYDAMQDIGFRTTVMGVPHWAPWDGNVLPEYYSEYSNLYKNKIRPLVREAELYHILPRPDGVNWDGMMYADPDSENEIKGLVFLFKPSEQVEDVKNIIFDGLYEDTLYQLTFEDRPEQNCTATGADLMTNGIDVEIKYVGSELIWITEAK